MLFAAVICLFVALGGQARVLAANSGEVVFYNTSSDAVDNSTCNAGDLVLNPPQTVGNAQTGVGGTFYCVDFNDIAQDFETFPMIGGGCPAGKGGFSLGGFGSYCITNIKSTIRTADAGGEISATPTTAPQVIDKSLNVDADGAKIYKFLQKGIDLLTAVAGLAITAMIIVGGIQYSASGGNPSTASDAKKKIYNAVLALICLIFLYAFLQWLVPGGIFNS